MSITWNGCIYLQCTPNSYQKDLCHFFLVILLTKIFRYCWYSNQSYSSTCMQEGRKSCGLVLAGQFSNIHKHLSLELYCKSILEGFCQLNKLEHIGSNLLWNRILLQINFRGDYPTYHRNLNIYL